MIGEAVVFATVQPMIIYHRESVWAKLHRIMSGGHSHSYYQIMDFKKRMGNRHHVV